jgi:tetratricopeptide (TPR) repeat protein
MENIDSAIVDYTQVIELDPNSFDGHYSRGHCYMERGRKLEAATDFQWVLENSELSEDKEEAQALLRKLGIKNVVARVSAARQ